MSSDNEKAANALCDLALSALREEESGRQLPVPAMAGSDPQPTTTDRPDLAAQGWQWVPREATSEMIYVICEESTAARWPDDFDETARRYREALARNSYRAALSAAPAIPAAAPRAQQWQPIETAPKDKRVLLRFGAEAISVAYWDAYYAEGGDGFTDGFSWIEPCSGDPLNGHYTTPLDGWQPLPLPPLPDDAKEKP